MRRTAPITGIAARQNPVAVEVPNVRVWLQADIKPPEIEVRFTPSNRHSGKGWECLKVTLAV